jgi:hypothetical protein
MKIPKLIFQTWKSKDSLTAQMVKSIQSVKHMNPEYEYYFFDDQDCRTMIQSCSDPRLLAAFDNLVPGSFKADLWRYIALYNFGGVYLDIDLVQLAHLRDIIREQDTFLSAHDLQPLAPPFSIYQAFMAVTPHHPALLQIINDTVTNVESVRAYSSCLEPTGPIMFGKSLNRFRQREVNTAFFPGSNSLGPDYELVLYQHLPKCVVHPFTKQPIFLTKYNGYQENLPANHYSRFSNFRDYFKIAPVPHNAAAVDSLGARTSFDLKLPVKIEFSEHEIVASGSNVTTWQIVLLSISGLCVLLFFVVAGVQSLSYRNSQRVTFHDSPRGRKG